jgi:hypothetical protein
MTTVIPKGEEAIHFAETHNLALNLLADGGAPARDGLTLEEAREVASQHPELVWVETHIGVNSGEPPHAW